MTVLLDRPSVDADVHRSSPGNAPEPGHRQRRRSRVSGWLRQRPSLLWISPILVLAAAVNGWGLLNAPQRVDDEGTYMAQAYAVQKFGELAHYTYWYDHPPLGWLQIAALTTVTGAFGWPTSAIGAGRVLMVVFALVSTALVWTLARRLELGRPAAAVAALLFALSPLAVSFHRMVYLDNIAITWTLAAYVLAASRHHQMASFVGAAACFTVAVLTKETFVLLLPPLVWMMCQRAHPATRRYTLSIAGATFVMLCSGYLVFAALKSEITPGPQRVSLVGGIVYQLFKRPGSGSIWQSDSAAAQTFNIWMGLDAVLLIAGLVCAIALFAVRRMRPLSLALIILAAMLLRTGYLPIPYVVAVIPFAAVLVAAAGDIGLRRRLLRPVVAVAAAAAVFFAAPAYATDLRSLAHDDVDRPMRQAQGWIVNHVDRKDRILIDDAVWVDLIRAGFPRNRAVWFFKADTDPAVKKWAPRGWRDYEYLMVTSSVRATLDIGSNGGHTPYPVVTEAYRHSKPVVVFGKGNDRVWVRRVVEGSKRQPPPPNSGLVPPEAVQPVAGSVRTAPASVKAPAPPTPAKPKADQSQQAPSPSPSPTSSPTPSPSPTSSPTPSPSATPSPTPTPTPTPKKQPGMETRSTQDRRSASTPPPEQDAP